MPKWKEEFNILAEEMDKRHKFLSMLLQKFPNYEDCPDKWKESWKAFEKDGFKNWRHMPKIIRRLKSAAKKKCNI